MRPQAELTKIVLQCLSRNQFFDAALSAIGYTLLHEAVRELHPVWEALELQVVSPDATVFIQEDSLSTRYNLDTIMRMTVQVIAEIVNKLDEITRHTYEIMRPNTCMIAIRPDTPGTYRIVLVYQVIEKKELK